MAARVPDRRILGLAVPALGALAAEPLYVLVDTAVVGHLGAEQLAGVAIGGALLTNVTWLCNFLAYGSTARASRLFGAGRRQEAIGVGVQATWIGVLLGVVLALAFQVLAEPACGLIAGDDQGVQDAAVAWLRIAALGAPFILVSLAGQGWMRGVQEVRRPLAYLLGANAVSAAASPFLVYGLDLGIEGSAIANVLAQAIAAALFLRALLRTGVGLRPSWPAMRSQLVVGRDLMARTLAMEIAFLTAAAVATRMGTERIAAHQIALQLWVFLALVLDSLAIAAQSLIGELLGRGDRDGARATARRILELGAGLGTAIGLALLAGWTLIPQLFSGDEDVVEQAHVAWPWLAGMQPAAGVLFALDGILIGAGDVVFLRNATIVAALGGFLPVTLAAYAFDLGLGGIWAGLATFLGIRLAAGGVRFARGRWAVVGAPA